MKRREFITMLGGAAAAWPLAARAQQSARMRIGVLLPVLDRGPEPNSRRQLFLAVLKEFGWTEGENLRIDYITWSASDADRLPERIAELLRLQPDVVLAGGTSTVAELIRQTRTVPVVFINVADPVRIGFIESLARPGGNLTGFTNFEYAMGGKWLQLLKEIKPDLTQTAVLQNPQHPSWAGYLQAIEAAARPTGIKVVPAGVHTPEDVDRAISECASVSTAGMIVLPDPAMGVLAGSIIGAAAQYRVTAVYPHIYFVKRGGLMSYGINADEQLVLAVGYIDRILRGAKPSDLPVQAATKLDLVINLKTANALGLAVPRILLARASELIE